jgi:hypothetical protein
MLQRKGDVRELADGHENEFAWVVGFRPFDDEVDRLRTVEFRLRDVRENVLVISVGSFVDLDLRIQCAEAHNAFRLFNVIVDPATARRSVDGDSFKIERIAAKQRVRNGMLVIQLIIGIRIQDDPNFFRAVGAGR